jgi:iron(III) transport system ATP-binding protein
MVSIQIKGLTKRFGDITVLDDIELRVEAGEMFFLLGPSGCGKTTLLRHIAGFHAPDAGSVWFGEEDVTRLPPHRRGTAMMFQSYALWPHLTVAENVAFGLEERQRPRAEIARRVREALAVAQLDGLGERRIQQLSGGQQQRVALARALVVRPHCLLLDEPLSNLDAQLRLDMRLEIRRICKEFGLTSVYVTHDQEEALSMADRLAVMVSGRLAQVGTPLEVYRDPVNRRVAAFIGETNLLPVRVKGPGRTPDTAVLETAAGLLTARVSHPSWRPVAGDSAWLSVRPEALRLDDPAEGCNRFQGKLEQAVYLGFSAQYRLRLNEQLSLAITEMNPAGTLRRPGQSVVASAATDDLIVLPD